MAEAPGPAHTPDGGRPGGGRRRAGPRPLRGVRGGDRGGHRPVDLHAELEAIQTTYGDGSAGDPGREPLELAGVARGRGMGRHRRASGPPAPDPALAPASRGAHRREAGRGRFPSAWPRTSAGCGRRSSTASRFTPTSPARCAPGACGWPTPAAGSRSSPTASSTVLAAPLVLPASRFRWSWSARSPAVAARWLLRWSSRPSRRRARLAGRAPGAASERQQGRARQVLARRSRRRGSAARERPPACRPSAPSTAALATSSPSVQKKSGVRSSAPSMPATPRRTPSSPGPGQTAVTVTPLPPSSSCTASLRLSTNALVAA